MNEINKKELLEQIIKKFDLAKGQMIPYEKNEEISRVCFKDIFNSLEVIMEEKELATLLGINKEIFRKFRRGKHNTKILMNVELSEKEKEEILEEIILEFDLSKEQLISYHKNEETIIAFKEIYEKVKSKFTEYELAELLGISKKRLDNIRKKGTTPVLKDRKYEKDDRTLLLELIQEYDLYKDQPINYQSEKDENGNYKKLCFYQIYESYKSFFTEMEMAKLLGGTIDTFYKMKIEGLPFRLLKNTLLLKDIEECYKKEIEQIVEQREGKNITYPQFKEIYEKYKVCITEIELASLSGISQNMLLNMKKQIYRPVIKDYKAYEKSKIIKQTIENRWYSLEEIEKICRENELEVNQFVKYIMHHRVKYVKEDLYLEALYKNNGLWIGHKKMTDKFIFDHYEEIKQISYKITRVLVKKYDYSFEQEDLISSGIEYIITNCGDIEENLKYDFDKIIRLIYTRTRKYLNARIVEIYKTNKKQISIDKDFNKEYKIKRSKELLEKYVVENNDIDRVIENASIFEENSVERAVRLFNNYLSQGYDKDIAIKNISRIFNIESEEMLEMMKKYLLEKGRVVENKNGEYEIGEQ